MIKILLVLNLLTFSSIAFQELPIDEQLEIIDYNTEDFNIRPMRV